MKTINHLFICAALFLIAACAEPTPQLASKMFGNVTLYYNDSISPTQVDDLGNYITQVIKLNDNDAQVVKNNNTYQVKLRFNDGMEKNEVATKKIELVAQEISSTFFNNAQVEIHACDANFNTLRVYPMATE